MKIQILNYNGISLLSDSDKITTSKLSNPQSLDEFDVNIIDLNSKYLWTNKENSKQSIDSKNDFMHLRSMLTNSQNTVAVVAFPQNVTFRFLHNAYGYQHEVELKNCLDMITEYIIPLLIPSSISRFDYGLLFENNTTIIEDLEFNASFYFNNAIEDNALTRSRKSGKVTTIRPQEQEQYVITTLNILKDELHLWAFLRKCKLISAREEYPQWLLDYPVLDDMQLKNLIETNESKIKDIENEISVMKEKLSDNEKYKSILFETGNALTSAVSKILEEVLKIDLTNFVDKNDEDFLISVNEELEFIGEIKGVTSNAKSDHVTQLDVHYQNYLEKLNEEGKGKYVKALLIINSFRTKPPCERDPIHQTQINLAMRNQSPIIETKTLLEIYEYHVGGRMKSEKCRDMLRNNTGLLDMKIVGTYLEPSLQASHDNL